jgi:zinc transporter ZupT
LRRIPHLFTLYPLYNVEGASSVINVIPGLFVVCLSVLVAVAGLMLVQPLVPATRRKEHNDVAGFIYAVLGVAYAVMLGLMIIAVWESFAKAETRSTRKPPSWPRSPGSPIGCPNPRVLTSRSWPALTPRLW